MSPALPRPLRPWPAVIALFAICAVVFLGSGGFGSAGPRPAAAATGSSSAGTVTTTATGKVTAVPDNLQANLAVHTTGGTATDVLNENNAHTQTLLAELKKAGVDDKDVQTTQLNLNTTFDNHGHVTGYAADESLTITFRNLKTAGAELDAMVASVGDAARIEGVQFGFNDEDTVLAAARKDAVKRARTQADDMAGAAGGRLGPVRTITEVVAPTYTNFGAADGSTVLGVPAAAVPLAAGSQDVTVQVKVVFALA